YKLEYFARNDWPASWITKAKGILCKHWEEYYKPDTSNVAASMSPPAPNKDLFAEIDNFSTSEPSDALEAYLSSPPLPKVGDPIMYWQSQLTGGDPLARMGLDFLSAPASFVDVERAFSQSGLTVSKQRHALSDESVRASTVFGS
ncbi:uncharacterized protein PHACADRAFT_64752, partial [Phanerochaete carnosa HHB-10118-sp]